MITGVAFVPQAPAIVPAIGRGLEAEFGPLREACRTAIRRVARPDEPLVLVADGDDATGFGSGADADTVGEWLVRDAVGERPLRRVGPDGVPGTDQPACALVVVGDGSACLSEKAPGYLDPEADARDELVRRALRTGDGAYLHTLGYDDARLLVAGSRVWDEVAWSVETSSWDADLLYDDAPFGVGYFVAVWTPRA